MNGRDTSAAIAVFCAIVSIGVLLKAEDLAVSVGGAVAFALAAAFMTKKAVMQTASEVEDNIGRIEVQFQQLRSKMTGEQVDQLERQTRLLDGISNKINSFENTDHNDQFGDQLKTSFEQLIEVQKVLPESLERLAARFDDQFDQSKEDAQSIVKELASITEKLAELSEQNAKTIEKLESVNSVITTGVKLVQVMGQLMKNPPVAKDVTHLSESLDAANKRFEEIHSTITENGKSVDDVLTGVRENMMGMTFQFDKSLGDFGEQIKGLSAEVEKLVERIDAYNGLTKATLDQYSMLTEQDVRVLEELTRRLEVRNERV